MMTLCGGRLDKIWRDIDASEFDGSALACGRVVEHAVEREPLYSVLYHLSPRSPRTIKAMGQ